MQRDEQQGKQVISDTDNQANNQDTVTLFVMSFHNGTSFGNFADSPPPFKLSYTSRRNRGFLQSQRDPSKNPHFEWLVTSLMLTMALDIFELSCSLANPSPAFFKLNRPCD